jgi:hypothetical protein
LITAVSTIEGFLWLAWKTGITRPQASSPLNAALQQKLSRSSSRREKIALAPRWQAGGRSRALTTYLTCITRRDTAGAHPFAPASTLIVIHSTARNGRINLWHANQHPRSLADEHVANFPPRESHASAFGFVPSSCALSLNVPPNWTSGTHAHIAFSPEYIYSSIPRASIDLYLLLLDSWSISSLLPHFFVALSRYIRMFSARG